MIKHYLKTALRNVRRSLLFSSINLLGFILGLTAALMIYIWVVDELTYDDCFMDSGRIYRVTELSRSASGEITESANTRRFLAAAFIQEFPQVEDATCIYNTGDTQSFEYGDGKYIRAKKMYVDSTFFRFFSFPVIEGNPQLIDGTIDKIVISGDIASKMFGGESALGKKLTVSFGSFLRNTYTVVAVVDIPRKSHIAFDVAIPIEDYGKNLLGFNWDVPHPGLAVYVKMASEASGDTGEMSRLLLRRGVDVMLNFQPLRDIHLHTRFYDPYVTNHGNLAMLYLFVALALVIIFMGVFNFTTLSTARAALRYREVGVRKVNGAKRRSLVWQFLSEGMLQAGIALVFSLALAELMLPVFNRVMDTELSLRLDWSILLFILSCTLVVGCLAGSYPAFYLSSVSPLTAFKGGTSTGRKGGMVKLLVSVQFVIATVLMLLTGIVFKQLNYIQNKDMGLDKENLLSVYTNLWYNVNEFKQEILRNPDVKSVTMSAPISNFGEGASYGDGKSVKWTDLDGHTDSLRMVELWADNSFVKTFGMELVKGELMDSDFDNYWASPVRTAVINETAWRAMKVADPIGMEIRTDGYNKPLRIVGVVKDFNFQAMREKIKPAFIWYCPEALTTMFIKIAPENRQQTLAFIRQKYEEFSVSENGFVKDFSYQFFSDSLNQNYASEYRQSRILLFFTVISIIIAVMGIFGLVSISTQQRTKEIGIRKVNGAHSDRIVRMLCREYLIWVAISFVIACPIAFVLMKSWLSNFAYQTSLSWWLFLLAGVVTALITMMTVIAQTWKKASRNPVESLRYE